MNKFKLNPSNVACHMLAKAYIRKQADAKFNLFSFLCQNLRVKREIINYSIMPPVFGGGMEIKNGQFNL